VINPANGNQIAVGVGDHGPQTTGDPYFENGIEAGVEPQNPTKAIDLSDYVWTTLGGTMNCNGTPADCSQFTGALVPSGDPFGSVMGNPPSGYQAEVLWAFTGTTISVP
jgi:hypothetical protein